MEFIETAIPGVVRIKPTIFGDERGSFREQYRADQFAAHGLKTDFKQDNISKSCRGVLRGLHYQIIQPQIKLVTVIRGSVIDVAVDLRDGSPTFGKHVSVLLTDRNGEMLYIPEGFAHGFLVLEEDTVFHYKCSDYYNRDGERSLLWNDPEIGIHWPIDDPLLSEKDQKNPTLNAIPKHDLPSKYVNSESH
jgi:dTDP-4-dehydrorhamnose 3,5-epimerase